jgi:hypothetical protein
MRVSAWKGGKFSAHQRPTLGVRIGRKNAENHFDRSWKEVFVELDGQVAKVRITSTFWSSCPELRSPAIGDWLRARMIAPWRTGRPPKLELTPLGGNRFRLSS